MNTIVIKLVAFLLMLFFISSQAQINLGNLKNKANNVIKKTEKVTDRVRETTGKDVSVKNTVENKTINTLSAATENIWFSKTRDGKTEKN